MSDDPGVQLLKWFRDLPPSVDSVLQSKSPLAIKIGERDRRAAVVLLRLAEQNPGILPETAMEIIIAAHALLWIDSRGESNWMARIPNGYPPEPARYTPEMYAVFRDLWNWLANMDWTAEETLAALDAARFWTTVMACSVAPNGNTVKLPVVPPAPQRQPARRSGSPPE